MTLYTEPLVDTEFYEETYLGEPLEDAKNWQRFESKAEERVNKYCGNWFSNHTMNDFPASHFHEEIQKAICAQIELFNDIGGTTERTEEVNTLSNVSIGNFSYNNGGIKVKSGAKSLDSSEAISYLKPTGLLYSGL